ncbi:hypothetical protein B1218_35385, partial [Pseudomonas ogarae]
RGEADWAAGRVWGRALVGGAGVGGRRTVAGGGWARRMANGLGSKGGGCSGGEVDGSGWLGRTEFVRQDAGREGGDGRKEGNVTTGRCAAKARRKRSSRT